METFKERDMKNVTANVVGEVKISFIFLGW